MGAAIAASALLAVGAAGLYVTTAPAWLSLAVEPLSLLLAPGLAAGLLFGKLHHEDPPYALVAGVSWLFWWVAVFAFLRLRARRQLGRVDSRVR